MNDKQPNVTEAQLLRGSTQETGPKSLTEALDRSAAGSRGVCFHDLRGQPEERLSYAEVRDRARQLGSCLLGLGLNRGDAVGIVASVHVDFLCAFFACQYAGLVAVPLPLLTGMGAARGYKQQLTRVLSVSKARVALGPAGFLEHLREAAQGLGLRSICTVAELAEKPSALAQLQRLGARDVSHIQFSSGSTAFPKGIQISQRALLANVLGIINDGLHLSQEDSVVSWLPFYHDMGLIGSMLAPVVAGIDAYFLPTDAFVRRPLLWPELLSRYGASMSFSPTFGYDLATRRMRAAAGSGMDLSKWRVAGLGGDMIQKPVLDRFADVFGPVGFDANAFLPSYGLAESTLAVTFSRPGSGVVCDHVQQDSIETRGSKVVPVRDAAPGSRSVICCGSALEGHQVEIRDESNRPLPERYIGAVYVRGPSLMDGYFQDDAQTRECITPDGWLDTGDMGYMSNGSLFITGRRKDMIIINARNIWPQDIEWHAEQAVPGIRTRDTAAFMHHTETGAERVVLLVQCSLKDPEELHTLKREVHASILQNVGVDCQVEFVPPKTITFTTSGKLMRSQTRQRWLMAKQETTQLSPEASADKHQEDAGGKLQCA